MKKQLFTLFTVALLVIGIICISWGIYIGGAPDNESLQSSPVATQDPTESPEITEGATEAPTDEVTDEPTKEPAPTEEPEIFAQHVDSIKAKVNGLELITYYFKAEEFVEDFGNAKYDISYLGTLGTDAIKPASGRYYLFNGYFYSDKDAKYEFSLSSGDAVRMEIGGITVFESAEGSAVKGSVSVKKGYSSFSVHAYGKTNISDLKVTCGGEEIDLSKQLFVTINKTPKLENMKLTMEDNKGLVCDIKLKQEGSRFTALVPPGIDLKKAVLEFDSNAKVTVGDTAVVSGQTKVDISGSRSIYVESGTKRIKLSIAVRQLDTGLPCVGITSEKKISSKTEYVSSYFAICGNGASYGADLPLTACGAKVRGAYSSGLEKKPYTLKFEKKTQILDLTPERSWILVASHLDLSQMRNYTAYEIAKHFDATDFAPRMRFVDVFVNGEYRGLYLLGDKVDISSTRFTLNQHETGPDVGVMLELEKDFRAEGTKGYHYFQTPQGWCVTFKDPDADELTKEQRDYIRDYFIAAEQAIISGVGYEDYIDVDSFIDWFLVETLFKNCDSEFTSSIYFHKDTGGKLKMGPVWDFDSGLGNHVGFPDLLDHTGWQPRYGTYFQHLMSHRSFRERMSKRWFEMHDVVESYFDLVDDTADLIRKSWNENFKVYNILKDGIWPVPDYVSACKTVDEQAEFNKDWVRKRIEWLDNEFSKPDYNY